MSDDLSWYEVRVLLKVRASDEEEAISLIHDRLKSTKDTGIFPVADFSVRDTEDPTHRPSATT